ncbi:MAG: DUF2330 domain-containing protein [Nannocystaceae bacterium]
MPWTLPPLRALALVAAASGLALTLAPARASACGGLFCDFSGPGGMPTPVDQTGENILFVVDRDEGTVEAQIQIQYMGDPINFAWVIPVTAIPDFAVGSELLFTNLLAGTVPTYGFTTNFDCQMRDRPGVGCGSFDAVAEGGDSGFFDTDGVGATTDGTTGGPQIVKREIVGAYEIVVLQGGTAQELYEWLDQNGYAQDDDAPPILAEYLAEGYFFAAAKLVHGAGIDQLQPLVMKYKGDRPCVPLRLTRIAAAEDMPIRVFALGDHRFAPMGYRHVELNDVRLDWINSATNYTEVVANAIDAAPDGQAFITEYAGDSSVVSDSGLYSLKWDSSIFVGAEPITADDYSIIDALTTQGLMECYEGFGCSYTHPLLLPILRTYLPTPTGIAEDDFYACMSCYEGLIDLAAWDGAKFAADLEERVIAPGRHARDLLARWPKVTRMLTIMSPHEMTADPEFIENPDLPDLAAARTATDNFPCSGSNKWDLPSEIALLDDGAGGWPTFDASMPWAREVQVIAPSGAPQVETSFVEAIEDAVRASNKRFDYDDGTGLNCAVRSLRSSWLGALSLGLVLGIAWRSRRRRAA